MGYHLGCLLDDPLWLSRDGDRLFPQFLWRYDLEWEPRQLLVSSDRRVLSSERSAGPHAEAVGRMRSRKLRTGDGLLIRDAPKYSRLALLQVCYHLVGAASILLAREGGLTMQIETIFARRRSCLVNRKPQRSPLCQRHEPALFGDWAIGRLGE